jgi:HD-GYP domain-containing protein (c-di-GMP phosphodiesterase class II)
VGCHTIVALTARRALPQPDPDPLSGRIVAIVDVFDALLSTWPYKDPWTIDCVVQYFGSESGHHFDPTLVDVFLRRLDDMMAIRKQMPDDVPHVEGCPVERES